MDRVAHAARPASAAGAGHHALFFAADGAGAPLSYAAYTGGVGHRHYTAAEIESMRLRAWGWTDRAVEK